MLEAAAQHICCAKMEGASLWRGGTSESKGLSELGA